ncbi:hypothetical protein ZOD2009_02705 [Haladaptatus paucihalophilus DX253]|uniref:Uncharacterized protein n=1 Tax=Haladaptatus paucihalophilus DX253 TaxID=797209 RepID=E7QPA2_HALPU|nr:MULTISPECIES: DUF5778 family protein [Haladaptatus]EFW94018.1 hypothetical protein ZOD2009_02705 [Haladaptatus paucihalophilus DX253]ODR82005.1 hypothetical protein BG842_23140 [Haladaptatus sp. W1]GKZ13127.1 hypothetical protein HAL_10080 [Haladaptatus sp. T7]SHK64330.1 hypothetical protein SAMN05444342_1950 [Haladaptatus paucihalophilus DX253]
MDSVIDDDLYERTKRLLEPGEIELNGAIVHTDLGSDEDIEMHQASVDVGDIIAEHAGHDPRDTYVYSGSDDTNFASNQHQGLTLDDEEFVWECQQLLRDGTFDIVFYYEASADQDAILEDIRDLGFEVTGVEG